MFRFATHNKDNIFFLPFFRLTTKVNKIYNRKGRLVLELDLTPIKNMSVKNGVIQYNFGIRKPVLNCEALLQRFPWENLIGKWIYSYENVERKDIFYKHIFINNRIIQIIYSGIDILGDGAYILYKTDVEIKKNNDFVIIPTIFDLQFGSFECEDYLQTLVDNKYITEEERDLFKNPSNLAKFKQGLYKMTE